MTGRALTARGERTRERLLDAAERLWGARGVDAVSLREIRIAAGQRNSSALQFHFGDRDGLLAALVDRHLPRIAARQEELYRALPVGGGDDDVPRLVEVLVRPNADYLHEGRSERDWTKVSAELMGRPEVGPLDLLAHAPPVALHAGARVHEHLAARLGPELATERLLAVALASLRLCADRARAVDAGRPPALHAAEWTANLVDMAVGAVLAPARASAPGH